MKLLQRTDMAGDSLRFVVAGVANTGLTVFAYQVLLYFTSSQLAYGFSWLLGLVFVAVVYPERVFVGGRTDFTARMVLLLLYAGLFVLGIILMGFLEGLGVPSRLSIFIVVGCTTLINFLAGRFWLRRS